MEVFPEIKIVDVKAMRERAGAFLSGVWNAGSVTEPCLTEHKRGAAEMLDKVMYDQPTLPLEGGRWDDIGTY
jgi:hypothetical protein